jgi:hypothetical protein
MQHLFPFSPRLPLSASLLSSRVASFVPISNGFKCAAEDGARASAVGLPDEAFAFHHVQDSGGATVAYAQASL